ncbi:MAG: type III pantothenate kinase [Betaproteobacteria bacterium]
MILVVDAGNTRVKWATHDGADFVKEGWCANAGLADLEAQWAALSAPSVIVIANVAGDEAARALTTLAGRWPLEPHWASSRRTQCGVTNLYENPEQLGVDRWAAMIGARGLTTGACVVVNAGTAMTVDALSAGGEFLGGFILPGFDLMQTSLAANTAKLRALPGQFAVFPRTTRDAIASGALQALCGAVDRMRAGMNAQGHADPELIFSGGTGELVAARMGRPTRFADKLVLEGLVRIAKDVR